MAKKRCGAPMPAQATTRCPRSQPASPAATVAQRSTGPSKRRAQPVGHGVAARPRRAGALTTMASTSPSWNASGARSGPAGITRPLPRPRAPSTTAIVRSLASCGFCKPVVHDDRRRLLRRRPARSPARSPWSPARAVARHQGRRRARQQQRLVADGVGAVALRHPMRPGQAPTVAARQDRRAPAAGPQPLAQMERQRRLAGAAGGQIADADDRQARAVGLGARVARTRRPAVERGQAATGTRRRRQATGPHRGRRTTRTARQDARASSSSPGR